MVTAAQPSMPCLFIALFCPPCLRKQMTAERRGRVTASEEAAEAAVLSGRVERLLQAVSQRSASCGVPVHAEGNTCRGVALGMPRSCQRRGLLVVVVVSPWFI